MFVTFLVGNMKKCKIRILHRFWFFIFECNGEKDSNTAFSASYFYNIPFLYKIAIIVTKLLSILLFREMSPFIRPLPSETELVEYIEYSIYILIAFSCFISFSLFLFANKNKRRQEDAN